MSTNGNTAVRYVVADQVRSATLSSSVRRCDAVFQKDDSDEYRVLLQPRLRGSCVSLNTPSSSRGRRRTRPDPRVVELPGKRHAQPVPVRSFVTPAALVGGVERRPYRTEMKRSSSSLFVVCTTGGQRYTGPPSNPGHRAATRAAPHRRNRDLAGGVTME
ncbi:hypothetical protein AGIG_G15684 [Arapaima gigas]